MYTETEENRKGNTVKSKTARALVALALGTALLGGAMPAVAADDWGDLLPPGEKAPAFEAVAMDGQPFALQEALAEGPVFLVFWSIF